MNINFGLFPPIESAPKDASGKRLRGPEKDHRPQTGAHRSRLA